MSIQKRQLLEWGKGRFGDYAARVTVFTDVKMFTTFSDCIQSLTHSHLPQFKELDSVPVVEESEAKVVT